MNPVLLALLTVETGTFLGMGVYFFVLGGWRLGVAQVLLAFVNIAIYSGKVQ
jgi:hypothetical protein